MDNTLYKQMARVYLQMKIDPIFMVPFPISEEEYKEIKNESLIDENE